uniref:Double-stranded RNA-binding protein 2 n=1 Tax=Anthurium amnicola TaxID=1678845 RepID=A0A1D1Y4Z2_9ARAE
MYKNQLQELAQRSCFNLPSYACIREGPDHAPRFKATVTFNGEVFESPTFHTTLRQAEHAAAEVALNTLSNRSPSKSLAAKVLDETGVYKNLLQETAHRAGLNLPVYTTVRSGPSHTPVFSCTVELAGMRFTGDPAKTKKQAQKNAAMSAWSALKQLPNLHPSSSASSSSSSLFEPGCNDEQEQVTIARALANLHAIDGKKPSSQNDQQQKGRHKPLSVRRDTNSSTGVSLYPVPYQGWAYSNFPPELAIYQMWQQQQASQQQSRLLTLPSPLPNDPRMLQYIQSMIHPNQGQIFPFMEQDVMGPLPCFTEASPTSMYFPFYPSPSLSENPSQVTIQEIHEENNQVQDKEWFCSGSAGVGGDTNRQKVNLPSETLVFSQFEDSSSHALDGSTEPKFQESYEGRENRGPGDAGKSSDMKGNIGRPDVKSDVCSSHPEVSCDSSNATDVQEMRHAEGSQREQAEWFCRGAIRHRVPNTKNPLPMLQMSRGFDLTQSPHVLRRPTTRSSLGPSQVFQHPGMTAAAPVISRAHRAVMRAESSGPIRPHFAAPVTIRTAVPVCSARPRQVNHNLGMPSVNSMAPAILIRPAAPACSASPLRMPDPHSTSGQEPDGTLPTTEDFGKLQI